MSDRYSQDRVLLAHGGGGRMSQQLIRRIFLRSFGSTTLHRLDDCAVIERQTGRLALSTDSFVVKPLFFPGGDIGKLAVYGTVNDLSMSGATPLYLSAAFVLEEGFPIADLTRIADSMGEAAREVGAEIVAGDTKVVESGKADEVFITTTGLGLVPEGVSIFASGARAGDKIILSGTIGDHGIAVLSKREGFRFSAEIESDCAPLTGLVQRMLGLSKEIHCLRDPTRGGLATALNELAAQSGVAMRIFEGAILVRDEVRAACELLGYDPLYVANEGKLVAVVAPGVAVAMVDKMRQEPNGRDATIIGEVLEGPAGRVSMATRIGGTRIVDMLSGELLPRIC